MLIQSSAMPLISPYASSVIQTPLLPSGAFTVIRRPVDLSAAA